MQHCFLNVVYLLHQFVAHTSGRSLNAALICIEVFLNCVFAASVRVQSTLCTPLCDWWAGKRVDGWSESSGREVNLALRLWSQTKRHRGEHLHPLGAAPSSDRQHSDWPSITVPLSLHTLCSPFTTNTDKKPFQTLMMFVFFWLFSSLEDSWSDCSETWRSRSSHSCIIPSVGKNCSCACGGTLIVQFNSESINENAPLDLHNYPPFKWNRFRNFLESNIIFML